MICVGLDCFFSENRSFITGWGYVLFSLQGLSCADNPPRGNKVQICRRIFPLNELLFPEMSGLFPLGGIRLGGYSDYREYIKVKEP